jgi:hypothetical protein
MNAVAPRVALLLPLAYLAHLIEEWVGGFPAWTGEVLGVEITAARFLLINALALPLFTVGTWLSLRKPQAAWFAAALAALVGLNGALHVLATFGFGRYSPGAITGLLLYLPLSAIVLRSLASRLPHVVLVRAVLFGFVLHAVVVAFALL